MATTNPTKVTIILVISLFQLKNWLLFSVPYTVVNVTSVI